MTDTMKAHGTEPAWQALVTHHAHIGPRRPRELFVEEPERALLWRLRAAGLHLDDSESRFNDETIARSQLRAVEA